ncbi:YoaK family protein [Chryseobacterium taklimakanense]|uniref:YoaK family protein n=1 Tax=Chryseobacterium taklimakanense TaxID=536441 RepID=UPI0023F7DC58|nr:YoaK family protein [Chryseobacterium taklimakanense]
MFAHTGKTRTSNHNLGIASLLSFVAGLVNVVGFFSVAKLTTNVTGHFAFFVDEAFRMIYITALHVALYVFFFFLGAFISNIMVETFSRISENYTYIFPVLLEAAILIIIALGGQVFIKSNPDIIAFSLLFAMGLQNSLVTTISNSVVRTTHLTGLFTDMGIEFSQLFFYKSREQKEKLLKSIKLRLTIIWMFFAGGIVGGSLFENFGIKSLMGGALLLLAGLLFDFIKIRLLLLKRKL